MTEVPGIVERGHLGPVLVGDVPALPPAPLALPAAAVAGGDVLRPLPALRECHALLVCRDHRLC